MWFSPLTVPMTILFFKLSRVKQVISEVQISKNILLTSPFKAFQTLTLFPDGVKNSKCY